MKEALFSYDLINRQITDNTYMDLQIEPKQYRIGQLFVDFMNTDFSTYDLKRKKIVKFYNSFKNNPDWENIAEEKFPDIKSQLGSLCEYTHGFCFDTLGFYLLLSVKHPYCSRVEWINGLQQFNDNGIFDFLTLKNKLQKYLPCLDIDLLDHQSPIQKFMQTENLSFEMDGYSFQEKTIFRFDYTVEEAVKYEISKYGNAIEFTIGDATEPPTQPQSQKDKWKANAYPDCLKKELQIIHGYSFCSAEDAFKCEVLKMLELRTLIRKCRVCRKYFIPAKHNGKCCNNLYKNTGLTCQQVYANTNYTKKKKEHPILKEYNRAYKRMYARRSNKKITPDEFFDWLNVASEKKEYYTDLYDNQPSDKIIDEFKNFLGNK